jgi:hypothetical protein
MARCKVKKAYLQQTENYITVVHMYVINICTWLCTWVLELQQTAKLGSCYDRQTVTPDTDRRT